MATLEERVTKLEADFKSLNDFVFLNLYLRLRAIDGNTTPPPVHQLPVNIVGPDRHTGHDFSKGG